MLGASSPRPSPLAHLANALVLKACIHNAQHWSITIALSTIYDVAFFSPKDSGRNSPDCPARSQNPDVHSNLSRKIHASPPNYLNDNKLRLGARCDDSSTDHNRPPLSYAKITRRCLAGRNRGRFL
jgi:hypothetical protein